MKLIAEGAELVHVFRCEVDSILPDLCARLEDGRGMPSHSDWVGSFYRKAVDRL